LVLKNPKDNKIISSDLHEASTSDVDRAVRVAKEAFETGPWSKLPGVKRGQCLNKLADLIEEYGKEIAYFESIASGRPLSMVEGEIPRVADVYRCE